MDIPDLVRGTLGDEEIQAGVSIGDEDAVCLTPTRTLIYRSEGLLSDEQVEEYSHDIEQLAVSEGRRKTKFTMQYIDGTESCTVPSNRGEKVLELVLEGVLRLSGVIDARESLAGVYRFSELTLIIAEGRVIKHIGSQVWSEDYEVYSYDDVTALDFERASVATSIALSVNGRPQRIKVPNDQAPVVRQTLEKALFGYYDVASIDELNRVVGEGVADPTGAVEPAGDDADDFEFGTDFDPLVSDEGDDLGEPLEGEERLATDEPVGTGPADGGADSTAEPDAGAHAEETTGTGGGQRDGRPAGHRDDRTGSQQTDQSDGRQSGQPAANDAGTADETGGRSADANADRSADTNAGGPSDDASSGGESTAADAAGRGQSERPTDAARPDGTESAGGAAGEDRADDGGASSQRTGPSQSQSAPASAQDEVSSGESGGVEPDAAGQDAPESDATGRGAAEPDAIRQQRSGSQGATATRDRESSGGAPPARDPDEIGREEFEALAERVDELTNAVDRQNELLKRQHRALKQLVQQQNSE